LAQSGVRFHFPFLELGCAPAMQSIHYRPAVLLVEVEALFGCHTPRLLIVAVDRAQGLQHEPALFRKIRRHLYEISPTVRITVGYQGLGQLRHISREGVTHLNGGRQLCRPLFQHLGQILAGVLAPGEIQRNAVLLADPY